MQQKHVQRVDVIVSGLLKVTAVFAHLRRNLLFENSAAFELPSARAWKFRQQPSDCVQGHRFAQQMRVRRKIQREITLEKPCVTVDSIEQLPAGNITQPVAGQVKNPDPGQRAERNFERARPIDAAQVWIGRKPACKLRLDFPEKLTALRQSKGLRQKDQVLMPVQLPDKLMIAGTFEIEIRNAPEELRAGFDTVLIIPPPADLAACLNGGPELREPVREHLVGQPLDCGFKP